MAASAQPAAMVDRTAVSLSLPLKPTHTLSLSMSLSFTHTNIHAIHSPPRPVANTPYMLATAALESDSYQVRTPRFAPGSHSLKCTRYVQPDVYQFHQPPELNSLVLTSPRYLLPEGPREFAGVE